MNWIRLADPRSWAPEDFDYVGLVTIPDDPNNDVYYLHTDKASKTARALTNISMPLKQYIKALEADARPIDEVMHDGKKKK